VEPKKSRYFTLMIMPDTSTIEVRRVRVSRRLITGGVVLASLFFLVCAAAFVNGLYMWEQARENTGLRSENESLRARISTLDQKLEDIDATVERVKQFDNKLREITMVSDPERHLAMGPVGGGEGTRSTIGDNPQLRADLLGSPVRSAVLAEQRATAAKEFATDVANSVSSLAEYLTTQQSLLASVPSRAPARGYVSSLFGMRVDPFTGLPNLHAGIDYSANIGARVSATADGVVIHAGLDGSYGKSIKIDHGNGLVTSFAHLSKMDVKVGDKVKRGQVVGAVGNTGRSTGPHLHYEVRINGVPVDPQRFLLD
jgi:murein DD-endopeptidase MepM/ murein hydrolase activator NlpD